MSVLGDMRAKHLVRQTKGGRRTGWMRTMGCCVATGSLRTNSPLLLKFSACGYPLCSALSPSSSVLIGCDRREYAAV